MGYDPITLEEIRLENISSIEDFNEILINLPYEIFLDIRDFIPRFNTDYNLFLRLLYVGITRTRNNVYILNWKLI